MVLLIYNLASQSHKICHIFRMRIKEILSLLILGALLFNSNPSSAEEPESKVEVSEAPTGKATPLDSTLSPNQSDDMIPSVYKDMVVVQRKAKKKANHFLFAPSFTLDFSDGPITNYAINTNIGYALSDFWEIYLTAVPAFITIERPIVQKVQSLTLAGGQQANIQYAKPLSQFGAEILWAPAYGKESWGPYSIVRSDTFFKLTAAEVNYQGNAIGLRVAALAGKTYFLSHIFNIRLAAGLGYVESIVDNQQTFSWVPIIETGLVFYF
jgi:hypothetical protein